MKKYLISLIAIVILAFSLLSWGSSTQSASSLPYPEPVKGVDGLSACKMTVANQIYLMRSAFYQNVNTLLAQEKPCSEMVDESFEALRTYRCWLDYVCEAVLYSANADPRETDNGKNKLVTGQIRAIPGCAKPENVVIPGTQIQFIPNCRNTSDQKTVEFAYRNFTDCKELVQQDFADIPSNPSEADVKIFGKDQSPAYIGLERSLKACSAEQQVRPLRDKFQSILLKMQGMESHMDYLKTQLQGLDTRMACFCPKCD